MSVPLIRADRATDVDEILDLAAQRRRGPARAARPLSGPTDSMRDSHR
jgi:hypothetical protein